MKNIRTGALIKATREMGAYRYDPRLKIPSDMLDFYVIKPGMAGMYLIGIPCQITAIANLAEMGPADLHSVLIGDKIVWQAWYECRREREGFFWDSWEIVMP